jgi:hypothetical protein
MMSWIFFQISSQPVLVLLLYISVTKVSTDQGRGNPLFSTWKPSYYIGKKKFVTNIKPSMTNHPWPLKQIKTISSYSKYSQTCPCGHLY